MSEVKNEGLEVVAVLEIGEVFYGVDGPECPEWDFSANTKACDRLVVELESESAHELCLKSEAIAGYAVRDAQISSLLKAGEELDDLFTATSLEYGVELDKRDTRIAELEKELSACATAVDNCELFRAKIAGLEEQVVGIRLDVITQIDAHAITRAELAAIKAQEPVDGVMLDDCEECSHPEYGRGYFFTDDCISQLYAAPVVSDQPSGVVLPSIEAVMRSVMVAIEKATYVRGTSNWCAEIGMAVVDEVARLNQAPAKAECCANFCNKCGYCGPMTTHNRPHDGVVCSYAAASTKQGGQDE